MAAPVPKTNELFKDLASLSAKDDFLLRRVENEAAKLMRVDASGGHAVLGAVAAIRGNLDRSVRHHELSVKLEDDVALWLNYCTSLAILDAAGKRLEVARRALAWHEDVDELLDVAVGAALESASFGDGQRFCDLWASRHGRHHAAAQAVGKLVRATDSGLFSSDGVRGVLEVAREVSRAAGVQRTEQGRILEPPDSPDAFLWTFQVAAPPAIAAQLNENLADELATRVDLLEDPGLRLVVMYEGAAAY